MSLKGPLFAQPPPDPRGMVIDPPKRACSSGLYSPSPEREESLPSKRGLSARLSAHSGQFQYLATSVRTQRGCQGRQGLREIAGVAAFFTESFLPKPDEVAVPWQEEAAVVSV